MLQLERAVDVEHVDIDIFSRRCLARPQIDPVVHDGQPCLLHLFVHVAHHRLRHQWEAQGEVMQVRLPTDRTACGEKSETRENYFLFLFAFVSSCLYF